MPSCKKMMMAHNRVPRFCAKKGYFCMHEMNKDGKGKGVFSGMSNRLYIFGHVEYKLIRVNVESTFVSRLIKNEMKIVSSRNSLFTRNITSSHKDEIKKKYGEIEHLHANL